MALEREGNKVIETNRRKTDLKIRPVKNYWGKGATMAREESCCCKLSRLFPLQAFWERRFGGLSQLVQECFLCVLNIFKLK